MKLTITILLLLCPAVLIAQNSKSNSYSDEPCLPSFSIGPKICLPADLPSYYGDFGYGLTAMLDVPASRKLGYDVQASLLHFPRNTPTGKTKKQW